jgi:integrase
VVATSNWTETTLAANEVGHALRHTFNVLALTVPGVSSHDVERLLAHAVPGVAAHYYHGDHAATEAHLRAAQCKITERILAACGASTADASSADASAA